MPSVETLALMMGQQLPPDDHATPERLQAVLDLVSAVAKSYTRGRGWTENGPTDDIETVIYTASMRWLTNPGQLPIRQQLGSMSVDIGGGFVGWTLMELSVLNRYRVMAL